MKLKMLLPVLFIIIVGMSCTKDNQISAEGINCDKLGRAFAGENKENLRLEIDKLISTLSLNRSADSARRKADMDMFVQALNECSDFNASTDYCLWCVYTLPPQTEITVSFRTRDLVVTRTIDLILNPDNSFKFSNVH